MAQNPTNQPEPDAETDADELDVSAAALFFGSDGVIYVSADEMPEEQRAGRDAVHVYALTQEEQEKALDYMHRLALNVPVQVFAKRRKAKRTR